MCQTVRFVLNIYTSNSLRGMESKGGGRAGRGSKSKGQPSGRVVRETVSVPRSEGAPSSPIPTPKVMYNQGSRSPTRPKPGPLEVKADEEDEEEEDG